MSDRTHRLPSTKLDADRARREAIGAEIDIQRALDHIDRVYSARMLYVNGLSFVLGIVFDEFNDFMDLEPTHKDSNFVLSSIMIAFVKAFSPLPPFGEALAIIATTAEGLVTIRDAVSTPESDLIVDQGVDKYLRNKALKLPILQNLLSARYQIEYDRLHARENFYTKMENSVKSGKTIVLPLDVAKQIAGPAPQEMDKTAIYELFARERENLFRTLMLSYIGQYVTILRWYKQFTPGSESIDMGFSLYLGLNEAQWRQLFVRYGTKASADDRRAVWLQMHLQNALSVLCKGANERPPLRPGPILNEVADLWYFWGAKLAETRQSWYGVSTISR